MPTTLVSGGTGYVGRFIVEGLIEAGHTVIVMGRSEPPAKFYSMPVRFVPGQLHPVVDQTAAFKGVDFFVHAAFDHLPGRYRGGEGDDPAGFRHANVDGSNALFDAARRSGVRRAVFLSSRAVYGTQPAGMALSESTRPHPDTLYGEVKHAVERHLKGLSGDGFAGTSLRVTGVYGPAGPGREDKWTPLIRDWLAGRPIEPRAGTEAHGRDVAAAVALVLAAPEEDVRGAVFNVSDILVDRGDLLGIAQQLTGSSHPLPPAADASSINVMDTARIEALGWRPGGAKLFQATVRTLVERVLAAQ